MDVDLIEEDWHRRGFSCAVWVDPPGQCWEDFVHATDELVMVVEGVMEFEVGGEIVSSEIGEELFIPAGVVHSTRNRGTTVARWLYGYRDTR
ncbi:MAG: cupin domain-containing protein [Nitrospirota bacterium]|jgi:mannose-6-phosphate isomerase-like protein (cupin superfamily)